MKVRKHTLSVLVVFIIVLQMGTISVQAATAKQEKAYKAYKTYLGKNESKFVVQMDVTYRNTESYKKASCFMVADLNKDGIKELITLHPFGFRNSSVYVYTFRNGKITRLKDQNGKYVEISECSWSNGGYDTWICKQKHLHIKWSGFSGYHEYVYRMTGGKLILYLERNIDSFIKKYTYTVNGMMVTQSDFEEKVSKCFRSSKGIFVDNSRINRNRYLK